MTGSATLTRAPGRPRDVGTQADLLRATQDLLVEVGFDRLTIDAVARRCGAGKTTIYRRWSHKTDLVVAAVTDLFPVPQVPDTGDLREDLVLAGRAFIDGDGRSHAVMASMLAAGRHHPELRDRAHLAMGSGFNQLFVQILTRAVARGSAVKDADVEILSEVIPTFAFHRTLALGQSLTEQHIIRLIDAALLPALTIHTNPEDNL